MPYELLGVCPQLLVCYIHLVPKLLLPEMYAYGMLWLP
jgi:hypothetical protein